MLETGYFSSHTEEYPLYFYNSGKHSRKYFGKILGIMGE